MRILFVCSGNTCRSCMAEAVFNKLLDNSDIFSSSAGVSAVIGSKTTKYASMLVKEGIGIDISGRKAVQVSDELLKTADLVLVMTNYIKDVLIHKFPYFEDKIFTLNDYVGLSGDIVDPYGGDLMIYRKSYKQIDSAVHLLVRKIKEDKGII